MKITDEQIERANYVNLPQFLMMNGFDLKKAGREYVWKEHDSLHIKDNDSGERGQWFRFSENKGGDNIGFLREYMGMSFVEAVETLNGERYDRTYTAPSRTYQPKPVQQTARELSLAEADNAKRVFAYLCKTRGLDYDLISSLVRRRVISQEQKTGNVLFKYYDENGKIIGAEKVGTSTEHKFKGIATGSAGGHGFEIVRGSGENAFFFESAIDMLSYLQMHDKDLTNCRLVSMMGVKPNIVLDTMLRHNISPENVFLCSDNDSAGNEFADRLREEYPEMKRIITPDTYKDWNDMLRGIPKTTEQKKEADMQLYGNKMWNDATDNRDKSLISMQLSDFQRMQDTLENSGINYYAYEMNGTVRMAVNDKDTDWLRNILGNVNITKSNRPYSPPEKNIIGNAEYRYIPQKEYLSADRDLVLKMAELMNNQGIQFSGRVYPSGKGTLTVSHNDIYAVREIQKSVIEMRKQFGTAEKGQEIGNQEYRQNRDTHFYMSKLTPEQFSEIKPFLETSVSYHAVAKDGKVAFAVDKENASAFHRTLQNAEREVGILRNMADLALSMEQNVALSPVIHRLAVEDLQFDLADFFDKRYDEVQFGEMLSLVNAYLSQSPAEHYGEHSKLSEMLEVKSSFDRSIELSDFFSHHDFSDEQRAAVTAMFVGDVTRGQIDSIDETFTVEDIQAYDEILHNALQESDVAEFLTAHKQAVIDRENAAKVPTEEKALFPKADLAKFLAERSLSSDEWEDMAYPLFERGHLDKHKPSDKAILGYRLSEPALYDLAHRYHNDEDIRRELALGLMEHTASEDIEFVFEDGKISDRTFYYADDLRHSLHTEKTEDGYNCNFADMERFVSFEEIGQAFLDRTHEEFEDLMYWRVLDDIKDDIPDISDETVKQLMTAFDGAAMADWEKGDNQPKINRIKKALFEILGDEDRTEKVFACIAKHKYNVVFEAEKSESSIHFGLLGNGITAYDVSRIDPKTHDYPIVAHISPEGVISLYDKSLSDRDMELIREQAKSAHEKFMSDWNKLSPTEQYQKLINRADIATMVNIGKEKLSMEEKIEKYMPFVFFGEGERPEPQMEEQVKGTYKIYQLPDGEKYHGIRFEGKEQLEKDGVQLNQDDYNLVYESTLAEFNGNATLEAIYTQFNTNHPEDFKGHSLSVSDVVVISVDGNDTAYFCDSMGFTETPEFFREKDLTQEKSAVQEISFLGDSNRFDSVKSAVNSKSFGTIIADVNTLSVVMNDDADVSDVRRLVETAQEHGLYLNVPSAKILESRFGGNFMQKADTLEVKKVHQVITNAGFDGGIDDKMEYATVDKAVKAGREYLADGYLGFSVFNKETKAIEHTEGDFPLSEAYNAEILKRNGIDAPEYKGYVTMVKVGDFFEMYGKDAEIGAEILGLHMLSKNGQPMVGFPDHIKNEYSKKFDEAGYTVLIEQAFELNPPKRDEIIVSPLDKAKQYINDFCESEYNSQGDFSDLHEVHIAYTTLTDDELPIQVSVDLVDYKITYEFDGKVFNTEQYDSIEEMNENALSCLDFEDLIHVPDDVIERHTTSKNKQTIDLMSDASEVQDTSAPADNISAITLKYMGDAESLAEIKNKALSLGATITVNNVENVISIDTYENHRDEIDGLAYELGLMAIVDEISDIDKPLFTNAAVIEEIQRNEYSDTPFWETPDIEGEQLTLFGDSVPLTASKPAREKPKSEFASGPVVDGVQVYEALAAEIDRGTGFVHGKLRVQDFYEEQHPTIKQLADFLKKEYGIGGHSGDGRISLVDYDSKGMTFSFENGEKFRHSWNNVAVMTMARLEDNTYLSDEQKAERMALKMEKSEVVPEETKPDIPHVKNLAQLKKAIKPGMMFEITDHTRPERIGERRVVTGVTTVDFTSRKLDENGEPMGKDIHMEFDRAKNWSFDGNELTSRLDNGDILMSFHFIDGSERTPKTEREQLQDKSINAMSVPEISPWGEIEECIVIANGVYEVTVPLVGSLKDDNIMISSEVADNVLSPEAIAFGFSDKSYICFSKDEDKAIVFRELIDSGVLDKDNYFKKKFNSSFEEKGEWFNDSINATLMHRHHDYWAAHENAGRSERTEITPDNIEVGDKFEFNDHEFEVYATESYIFSGKRSDEVTLGFFDDELNPNGVTLLNVSKKELAEKGVYLGNAYSEDTVQQQTVEQTSPEKSDNFTITDDNLGEGGAKAKFRANVAAIRMLKNFERANLKLAADMFLPRPARAEEKEMIAKYVGWGSLAQAFDPNNEKWAAEYKELAELLTPEEYRQARASVNDAFYTSPTIIDGIYEALNNFGFDGGNVLEPAMGIGNFFGRMPEDMQKKSKLYGVEIDSISGRIAQALYPDADIAVKGFEQNTFQNGCFDVAIGNVPFGDLSFVDTIHNTSKLHDYFFAESLDKLKNGGIMAFVTSAGTLDKRDESARRMLADRADFIGAIRLPGGKNGAFKDNAGTEVTTDIIFLQKHEGKSVSEMSDIPDWVHIGETSDGLPINKYFEQNHDMVLGKVVEGNKLYGSGTMVVAEDGFDLKSALHDAVSKLSAAISPEKGRDVYAKTAQGEQVQIPSKLRNYSFFMSDDQVYFKKNNTACEFRFDKTTAQHKRFKAFIELRDLTRELIEAQELNKSDGVIKDLQGKLNIAYDDFYKKYGLIHSQTNKRYFSEDVSYNLVAGLEKKYDKTKLVEKSDIFTKRTIVPPKAVDHVETALEALTLSAAEKARVDFAYMSSLTGMTEDELKHDLQGEIFKVPHTENDYQTASEYLSGDIRKKLREAEEIAEYDADFNVNVSALKAAMPEPLKAGDIDVKIGATWIDPKYYDQFLYELLQTPNYQRSDSPAARWSRGSIIGVEYSEHTNSFHVSNKSSDRSVLATQKYGSHHMNAYDIFEHILNLQEPKVYKTIEVPDDSGDMKEKRVVDIDATRIVQRKADNIRKAFKDWIFKDPARREDIVNRYNELFNSIRPREYDGSALSFPMMTADIQLHEHQKNAIAHAMFGGNTLFAHSVGAGKSATRS